MTRVRMFVASIPEPHEHITFGVKMSIVGRMRQLRRECASEAMERARSMPWGARARSVELSGAWWCFRGVAS